MEDERGSTPRGASPRSRAGEPAAAPTRATGRPPAAIFMEPAIPAPREAEPEAGEQREAYPPSSRVTDPKVQDEPVPARTQATPPAAEPPNPAPPVKAAPAKAVPAKAVPARATPAQPAPAKATPAKATTAAKASPATKAAPPVKTTKTTKATAPVKATASKATKATAPAKPAPTKAAPAKAPPKAAAPTTTTAPTTVKAAGPVLDEPRVDPPAEPPARVIRTDPGPVPSLWDRVRAEPRQAPELLATAAVERYGPEADRYTRWIRATYPAASDDRIAHAAARRFTAQARHSALAAVVGHGAGEAAALGWVQARMVLHIAAAYRLDPAAPERAADLLTLMGSARVPVGAGLRAAGRGLATRLVPGAGLLLGALLNDADTGSLARRAISLYRPVPRLP